MSYTKVTSFLSDPVLSAIKVVNSKFYRGNVRNDNDKDPRIQLRVCFQKIVPAVDGKKAFIEQHEGIPYDAYFITVLRQHAQDEDGSKLQTKVGALLRSLDLPLPESSGLIKGIGQANDIINENLEGKEGLYLAGWVSTKLAEPQTNGQGVITMGPRFANIVSFDQLFSPWVRSFVVG
tara:strand:- start:2105 stop:2638 length:534 start_codon:yes stop_codon:yes gene_type:complete